MFGSIPSPTLKLATNAALASHMHEDIDVDCSPVLQGDRSVDEMGEAIFQHVLEVASGRKTASEALDLGREEFVPWQVGAIL